jgi:hypothetical protein
MDQNPYKSPEKAGEEKPADNGPSLPQWRMKLGIACYVVGTIMTLYGLPLLYPPSLPHSHDCLSIGVGIAVAGYVARHRPTKFGAPSKQKSD